jgi:hypothetical protein
MGSNVLAASSSDGYITFVKFEKDELGTPVLLDNLPDKIKDIYSTYTNCDISKNVTSVGNSKIYFNFSQYSKAEEKAENRRG